MFHVHSPGKIRHPVGDTANPLRSIIRADTANYHLASLEYICISAIISASLPSLTQAKRFWGQVRYATLLTNVTNAFGMAFLTLRTACREPRFGA